MKLSPEVGSVRKALRDATADNHHRVDELYGHFALNNKRDYVAFLRAHARALGALEAVAGPQFRRLPLLRADLDALGEDVPGPLSLDVKDQDGWRWGVRYALEGSRLGGAMLARRVDPTYPHAYLSAVHEKGGWVAFQEAMAEAAEIGDEGWLNDAIAGAKAAFAIFAEAALTRTPE